MPLWVFCPTFLEPWSRDPSGVLRGEGCSVDQACQTGYCWIGQTGWKTGQIGCQADQIGQGADLPHLPVGCTGSDQTMPESSGCDSVRWRVVCGSTPSLEPQERCHLGTRRDRCSCSGRKSIGGKCLDNPHSHGSFVPLIVEG